MSIEGGEEHQIAPDIVEVFATRGDDGLFGVDIMDSPSHQIYHVVVTILPGSAADTAKPSAEAVVHGARRRKQPTHPPCVAE